MAETRPKMNSCNDLDACGSISTGGEYYFGQLTVRDRAPVPQDNFSLTSPIFCLAAQIRPVPFKDFFNRIISKKPVIQYYTKSNSSYSAPPSAGLLLC
jgi:hypothetical protein